MLLELNKLENLKKALKIDEMKTKIIDEIYYDYCDLKYDEMLYDYGLNDILKNRCMRKYNIDNFYNTYFDIDLYDPSTGYINDEFINDIIEFIENIGVYELPDYIYDFMEYQTENGYEIHIDDLQTIQYNFEQLQYSNYNNELLYDHFGNCIDYIDGLILNIDDLFQKIIDELQNALSCTVNFMIDDIDRIYHEPEIFYYEYIETENYKTMFQDYAWNTENNTLIKYITEVK